MIDVDVCIDHAAKHVTNIRIEYLWGSLQESTDKELCTNNCKRELDEKKKSHKKNYRASLPDLKRIHWPPFAKIFPVNPTEKHINLMIELCLQTCDRR